MKRLAPTRFRKMVKEQFMASMQKVKKYQSKQN
jgi:hypothetical protein